jgi:serine/threonine protein kinase
MRGTAHKAGANLGAVKELQVLREIAHPNVLRLLDAFAFGGRVHFVLEHCQTDLKAVALSAALPLPEAAVKGFMLQLLRGLEAVHSARLMHRDLKPDNILITGSGVLKLADFGHSCALPCSSVSGELRTLHPTVVTLYYRAPELLCRAKSHGPAVDMWAAGCILAELLLRAPIFPGGGASEAAAEAAQLREIVRLLGPPIDTAISAPASAVSAAAAAASSCLAAAGLSEAELQAMRGGGSSSSSSSGAAAAAAAVSSAAQLRGSAVPLQLWPGCSSLPGLHSFEQRPQPRPWRDMHAAFQAASQPCLDLLSRLLAYDPLLRLSAREALQHPWFRAAPQALEPAQLPLPRGSRK